MFRTDGGGQGEERGRTDSEQHFERVVDALVEKFAGVYAATVAHIGHRTRQRLGADAKVTSYLWSWSPVRPPSSCLVWSLDERLRAMMGASPER